MHLQFLNKKYQRLTRYIHTLIKSGRYALLSKARRISLVKRWQRYHNRLANWRPRSITAMSLGLYMVLTSSTCHHFTLSPDATPFGLTDVGFNSTPTFADIDGDGDMDAFIGETGGNVNFFKNIGSASAPNFSISGGASPLGLTDVGTFSAPTFADIDGDGHIDAFIGDGDGNIHFFKNNGTAASANFVLQTIDIGLPEFGIWTAPTFADIDGDGDLDAFVGNNNGDIGFFRNISTSSEVEFETTSMSSPFGLTKRAARSIPSFADIDGDGDLDAFVGELSGKIVFFNNIGNSQNANFELATSPEPFGLSDVGFNSAPAFVDIDGDGDLDAFIGAEDGSIKLFAGTAGTASFELSSESDPLGLTDVESSNSTPAFADIDGDGDLDAFIGEASGDINFFRNGSASDSGSFVLEVGYLGFALYGQKSAPAFMDIDGDGDLDAFVGRVDGSINFFRNISGTDVSFATEGLTNPFGLIDVGGSSIPTFADIDGDGDLDAFVGEADGNINFFRNGTSMASGSFVLIPDAAPFGLSDVGTYSAPTFADIDGDGDLDAFVGHSNTNLSFFINVGNSTAASFNLSSDTTPFGLALAVGWNAPSFADIDGDGDLDAFIGDVDGNISLFKNVPCKSSHDVNHAQLAQDLFMTENTLSSRAVIRNGRDVIFSAGDGMVLDSLFEVREGATFMGLMNGCPLL